MKIFFGRHIFQNQSGISMMESVVALFVIMVGVTAALGLIISSASAAKKTSDRLLAANLAREGIEIVRGIRDTNWLRIEGGETIGRFDGLLDGPTFTAVPLFDESNTRQWTLNYAAYTWASPETRIYTSDFFGAVLHNQYLLPPATGQTNFQRLIDTFPICNNAGNEVIITQVADTCGNHSWTTLGIQVLSHVSWQDSGSNFTQTEEVRLYDWK